MMFELIFAGVIGFSLGFGAAAVLGWWISGEITLPW